jgi:D-alanyl-D-alanine carboxypeptidase/D-alanyl-D-alanine-endopeptidase (penicillin-binding protein 4)
LLVAAVALEALGEQFSFTTSVASSAAPVGGVLDGDLMLIGGGDPVLSSDWYPTSNLERFPVTSPTSLDALADAVAGTGLVQITGSVVGDGSRYDDEWFAPGWGAGVAGLEAGPYDALIANDARVLGEDQRSNDPNQGAAQEFTRLLQERGVIVQGEPTSGTTPADATVLAEVDSAPLGDVVGELLLNSDNNTAELLVKEIGYSVAGNGTRQAGLEVMGRQLADWGVPAESVVLADGSGLSLDNRLTCNALLNVLQRSSIDGPIGAGMPVAAESGALADVFTEHPLAGVLRGKTGTLNNPPFNQDPPAVKALAGFVGVEGGSQIEYALVLNGPTISDQSEYRQIWGSFADVLATYPSGPTPADVGLR